MIQVRHISKTDKETIDDIVRIHLDRLFSYIYGKVLFKVNVSFLH